MCSPPPCLEERRICRKDCRVFFIIGNRQDSKYSFRAVYVVDGRFKIIHAAPDGTVETVDDTGKPEARKITLPEGRHRERQSDGRNVLHGWENP